MLLGGRAAEQVAFGKVSTGAADDLERVTAIARAMVFEFGMGETVHARTMRADNYALSEETKRLRDEEQSRICDACYGDALALLERHRGALDRLAEALLERETLDRTRSRSCSRGVPVRSDESAPRSARCSRCSTSRSGRPAPASASASGGRVSSRLARPRPAPSISACLASRAASASRTACASALEVGRRRATPDLAEREGRAPEGRVRLFELALELLQLELQLLRLRDVLALLEARLGLLLDLVEESHVLSFPSGGIIARRADGRRRGVRRGRTARPAIASRGVLAPSASIMSGVAVRDVEAAVERYSELLGAEVDHEEHRGPTRACTPSRCAWARARWWSCWRRSADDTPVGRFLPKRGEGMHHVAYRSTDLDGWLDRLAGAAWS